MKTLMTLSVAVLGLAMTARMQADDAKTDSDAKFLQEAASGGMLEVKLGKLAAERAQDAAVKQFGERMVADHCKANKELMVIAQGMGVKLPQHISKKDQATFDKLSALQGSAFDKAYIQDMVMDHVHDVAEFTKEAKSAQHEQVRSFAGKTLPTLQEHLQMARQVASKIGVSANK